MIGLIICSILQGLSKSASDKLQFHHSTSVFNSCSPLSFFGVDSWKRKYKNGEKSEGEAFPLSTSLLVFITDALHFSNFIQIFSQLIGLYIALNLYLNHTLAIYYCLGYWTIRTAIFHVFFTYFLKSKNHVSTN